MIEDNAPDVLLIEMALAEQNIKCDFTRYVDGEQALIGFERARAKGEPPPDLIFLDLNLPKVSGFEVLRSLRQDPAMKQVRVVVLTSSEGPMDKAQAWALGADRYITKPSDLHAYLRLIGQSIQELLPEQRKSA
jgi:chemotaxis family two-component system response regulator Rcp1